MDHSSGSARDPELDLAVVREAIAAASGSRDDLLALLHAIQHRLGHVPKAAMPLVAEALNISRAEVQGVVSFYHDFHEAPTATHVIQLCMAEACQAVGCRELAAHAQRTLGVDFGQPTPDGRVQLEPIYCLGNCAAGPSVRVGARVHGRVDARRLDAVLEPLRGGGASR